MPKISVIIPCYNQGAYLKEAVESVLAQTYEDFEIIIVNDGSTDNTKALAHSWMKQDPRIYFIEQTNQGLASARNNGIKISRGEFILPLDADDKISPNYLGLAVSEFNADSKLSIVYGRAELFGELQEDWLLPYFSLEEMLKRNLIYCSAIFRKTTFSKTTGYNPNMKYGWEDWDLWLSMIEQNAIFYKLDETVFYYRIKEISMVKDIDEETYKRQYLEQQLIANHFELYKKYFPEPLTMLRELGALRNEKQQFEKYKKQIYNSASYRLGSFLLKPFKYLKNLFQ